MYYILQYGDIPGCKTFYAGRNLRLYAAKASAAKYPTLEHAEAMVRALEAIWASNPSYDTRLLEGLRIVPVGRK